jgi:hypothetical protein
MYKLFTVALVAVLTGCQTTGAVIEDRPNTDVVGNPTESNKLSGPDGIVIKPYISDAEYWSQTEKLAKNDTDLITVEAVENPFQRPTVTVQYLGKPPTGVFDNLKQQVDVYNKSYMDGDTIVYNTDLAKMTLVMERPVKAGQNYEYKEMDTTVPYGMCLDFIEENLGKESDGFILRRVECNQEALGIDY